jgi:hypothetical protein
MNVKSKYQNPDRFIATLKAQLADMTQARDDWRGRYVCPLKIDHISFARYGNLQRTPAVGDTVRITGRLVMRREYYDNGQAAYQYEIEALDMRTKESPDA